MSAYAPTPKPAPICRQLELAWWLELYVWLGLWAACYSSFSAEPALTIQNRTNGVFLWISGGTSNVQYQIFTSPDNKVASTNWYYWRRAYSIDFLSDTNAGQILLTSTNTPWRTQGFFNIRGVLPD